jgi:hypothetical protein
LAPDRRPPPIVDRLAIRSTAEAAGHVIGMRLSVLFDQIKRFQMTLAISSGQMTIGPTAASKVHSMPWSVAGTAAALP